MANTSKIVKFTYGTVLGRLLLKCIMKLHLDRLAVRFLWSAWSRPAARWYVRRNGIEVSPEQLDSFATFREMFVRVKENVEIDPAEEHLISPCDGWLSVFPVDENSSFHIKNSHYRLKDILQDEKLAANYVNGTCLIFRLCASDYHHYCYIDDGFQGENHFIPGVLHSVQPIACEKYPVYTLNRRCWCLLTTDHFGPVVQCEIGALIVGGIFNEKEQTRFRKGTEKGHFELAGSTIAMLFEEGQITLLPEMLEEIRQNAEARVRQGQWIGNAAGGKEKNI